MVKFVYINRISSPYLWEIECDYGISPWLFFLLIFLRIKYSSKSWLYLSIRGLLFLCGGWGCCWEGSVCECLGWWLSAKSTRCLRNLFLIFYFTVPRLCFKYSSFSSWLFLKSVRICYSCSLGAGMASYARRLLCLMVGLSSFSAV